MLIQRDNALARIALAQQARHRAGDGVLRPSFSELVRLASDAKLLVHRPQRVRAGLSFGVNDAVRRGHGMTFAESRPWVAGDDARNVDWRVTARTGKPHTKTYDAERDQCWMLFVDMRRSMMFGTRVRFKSVQAARVAAVLAWGACFLGNRIGAVIVTDNGVRLLPPQGGQAAVLAVLKSLTSINPLADDAGASQTFSEKALADVERLTPNGATLFMISDFMAWQTDAHALVARLSIRFPALAIPIYDRLERHPPPCGTYPIRDSTNATTLQLTDEGDRQWWSTALADNCRPTLAKFESLGIRVTAIGAHDDFLPALSRLICGEAETAEDQDTQNTSNMNRGDG